MAPNEAKPTLTQARSLSKVLRRTLSTFLLPEAPPPAELPAEFRHAPGSYRTKPSFEERLYLRQARRIQEAAKWLSRELGEGHAALRKYTSNDDVEEVGQYARQRFKPLLPTSLESWRTPSQAFRAWRTDFPHWDHSYPHSLKELTERPDVTEAEKRQIFSDNPRRLYAMK